MPSYTDDAAELIRRLLRPAAKAGDMLDTAGDAGDLARVAPPTRMQVELPMEPRTPSFEGVDAAPPSPVDLSIDSPAWGPLSKSADRYGQMRRGQTSNLRNQPLAGVAGQAIRDADAARQAQMALESSRGAAAKTAAGVGVAGAAGAAMLAGGGKKPEPATADITSTDGTAELANESRPAPVVAPDEESEKQFTETFKRQYLERDPRQQADRLIADLNERRRKAGGEVPEAPQMLTQINQLLATADERRNSRTPQQVQAAAAGSPNDSHAQASALLADLNARRQRAGGEVPDSQKVLAEVRRLQQKGDGARNARRNSRGY